MSSSFTMKFLGLALLVGVVVGMLRRKQEKSREEEIRRPRG